MIKIEINTDGIPKTGLFTYSDNTNVKVEIENGIPIAAYVEHGFYYSCSENPIMNYGIARIFLKNVVFVLDYKPAD